MLNSEMNSGQPLGLITQGSLSEGLEVRLHPDISVEDMRVGKFLIVQGVRLPLALPLGQSRFFCMLTDVELGTSSSRIVANPPGAGDDFLLEVKA